jgi:hypothetical protein
VVFGFSKECISILGGQDRIDQIIFLVNSTGLDFYSLSLVSENALLFQAGASDPPKKLYYTPFDMGSVPMTAPRIGGVSFCFLIA